MSEANAEARITNTRRDFEEVVWPEIRHWFCDEPEQATLVNTEDGSDELNEQLDWTAGVDYCVFDGVAGFQTIAQRTQPSYKYDTFTVRYSRASGRDTEHQKRVYQYRDARAMLPRWTVQAYIDPVLRELQTAAAVSTADLFEYVLSERAPIAEEDLIQSDSASPESFYTVDWASLLGRTDIRIYNRERTDLGTVERQEQLNRYGGDSS